MVNQIHEVRHRIECGLASAQPCLEGSVIELSPCGRYRLEIEEFVTAAGEDFSVAVVRRAQSGQNIATVKRNDGRCFYSWVSRAGHDYLLFPEDLEGQTVIDLITGQVVGFSSPDDSFIWTEFHPSPNRTKLAIIGCYWACPYQVAVYDFQDPMILPLPKLAEFALPENNAEFEEWITEAAFRLRSASGSVHIFEVPGGNVAEPDTPP